MDADYDAAVAHADTWVADDGGQIVGLLILVPGDDHVLVENVAVDPGRQGEGIGRALLAFAEQRAAELGVREMRLYTHVLMTENIALYQRAGYVETHRISEKGFDRVYMTKRL